MHQISVAGFWVANISATRRSCAPGTPETRRAANTYLPGYGPAGGKGERNATKMLTGG
jgi:hypothetical protein